MPLSNTKITKKLLLSIFLILTFLLCIGGYVLYRYQKINITIEKHQELSAISKLKVDEIVNWRKERLVNARSIYNNQAIIIHIREYIRGVDRYANHLTITSWIKTISDEPDYSIVSLIDPSGKIVINTNPDKPITATGKRIIADAILSKDVVFSDLLKYSDNNIFIDLAIPLYAEPKKREGFTGIVLIRIDPEKFLYPYILNWPTSSHTGEVLLVRHEGDSVLYLSELQYKENTALRLRRPMTDKLSPIVQVMNGKTGILEGVDYKGIKVLGDTQPIPNTPWYVVTKVDMDEIYHPIFAQSIWIFFITFLLILITALIVWTRQLKQAEQERILAFEKLRNSEEGFRTLAESIPQIVSVTEADGMNIYFSPRWTEYTGLTMEESNDTGWIKPYHPQDIQRAMDVWQHSVETGEPLSLDCRLRKYNGEYHWFVIKAEPLHDRSGNIIKWYGSFTNIDIPKQLETEIKKLNEDLEHRVDERTIQLQDANKELESFSYSVSHDLRGPLHNINGWSLALLEHSFDQLDAQGRQFLDHVRSETIRMSNLIDALLNFSRLSRAEINKVNVDLTMLAHDITKRLVEPTDQRIEIDIQEGMFAFGDPELLEIVLTNLLNNAYKFSSKQPFALIEFGHSMIDEKQTFWIRDNGAGFNMAYAKNLFSAFQRMHKQSDFPGTGIGLATVQRIIHRHGGDIRAESEINKGTIFYFTIPEKII